MGGAVGGVGLGLKPWGFLPEGDPGLGGGVEGAHRCWVRNVNVVRVKPFFALHFPLLFLLWLAFFSTAHTFRPSKGRGWDPKPGGDLSS